MVGFSHDNGSKGITNDLHQITSLLYRETHYREKVSENVYSNEWATVKFGSAIYFHFKLKRANGEERK